jgi:hypothetical protein
MKRVWMLCACASALWAGACSGGGGSLTTTPPPNTFSNSNLQGQYAFSMAGSDASTGTSVPFTRIGSFIADGKGDITGGTEDVNLTLGRKLQQQRQRARHVEFGRQHRHPDV